MVGIAGGRRTGVKVFSNAGPLVALSKLGHVELLYRLFGRVGLPTAVYHEVVTPGNQRGYPDALLIEMALRKKQLAIVEMAHVELPSDIASLPLDKGEKEAIYLATCVPNSLVLLDDLKAREEAKARNLAVKGTIGIMVHAYRNGLVTLEEMETIFEAIISIDDIWIAPRLCHEVINRLKTERRKKTE
jgi:predicted nucleic acid-binding protein